MSSISVYFYFLLILISRRNENELFICMFHILYNESFEYVLFFKLTLRLNVCSFSINMLIYNFFYIIYIGDHNLYLNYSIELGEL